MHKSPVVPQGRGGKKEKLKASILFDDLSKLNWDLWTNPLKSHMITDFTLSAQKVTEHAQQVVSISANNKSNLLYMRLC